MTNEEALEILRKFKPCEQGFCNGGIELLNNLGGLAMELAIFSLEKRIPKKPENIRQLKYDPCKVGFCPSCSRGCYNVMEYCDECGQALDWSDCDER